MGTVHTITVVFKGGGTVTFHATQFKVEWDENTGKPVSFSYTSPEDDSYMKLLFLDPDEIGAVTTQV